MQKLLHIFTKMAITSPRKVQIPKFWCLKSSTSIWPSFGNINSIQKVKNMELEQKEGSKLAKIGQIFALKKLNLHFLKNFPRFDLTSFFCDFQCIRPIIIHWQSSLYRTGVVGGLYGWRGFKAWQPRVYLYQDSFLPFITWWYSIVPLTNIQINRLNKQTD